MEGMEQVNDLTHWIDASNVYGSDNETADRLRGKSGDDSWPGALLKTQTIDRYKHGFLPEGKNQTGCATQNQEKPCVEAGKPMIYDFMQGA